MPSLQQIPSVYKSILFQARLTPHATAVALESREMSYREFARDIERVTRRLHRHGVEQGQRIGVLVDNTYLRWVITVALVRLGVVSVALYSDSRKEVDFIRARTVIVDNIAGLEGIDAIQPNQQWLGPEADAWPAFKDTLFARDTPCRMVLSSGTTGLPKKAMLTYGDVADRILGNARTYGLNATARLLTTMGMSTIGGFMMYVACWANGGTALLVDTHRSMTMMGLLAMRPNVMFSSPAQLEALMQMLPKDYWPSNHLYLYVAGSTLPNKLSRMVRSRLTQSLFVIYGSTEAGTMTFAHALRCEEEPGFTGYVVPMAELQVVDDNGQPVETGVPGDIRVRSHGMVARYEDEPEGTDAAFRDGWFYPGDLGRLTPDEGLVLLGRTREVMNFGGKKLAPDVIEEALADCPGIAEMAAFSIGSEGNQRPWVAVVDTDEFNEEALHRQFAKSFPGLPKLSIARTRDIPRNEMGKVLRGELRSRVERALASSTR
ncbi:MAG: class I adenylate-forming enzyme family protein [Pseudomonadota bacterium]